MTETPILDERAVSEIEARLKRWTMASGAYPATWNDVSALCATVKHLWADLKFRCEALEELRRCRDRWLTMLNPASADETVDGAIRNLQQAYISERDNAVDLQSQLEQLRAENEKLQNDALKLSKALADELKRQ